MLDLESAIRHCEEVAEKNEKEYEEHPAMLGYKESFYNCKVCAEDHRQLAEWLKDYKQMLENEKYLRFLMSDYEKNVEQLVQDRESEIGLTPAHALKTGKIGVYAKVIEDLKGAIRYDG